MNNKITNHIEAQNIKYEWLLETMIFQGKQIKKLVVENNMLYQLVLGPKCLVYFTSHPKILIGSILITTRDEEIVQQVQRELEMEQVDEHFHFSTSIK